MKPHMVLTQKIHLEEATNGFGLTGEKISDNLWNKKRYSLLTAFCMPETQILSSVILLYNWTALFETDILPVFDFTGLDYIQIFFYYVWALFVNLSPLFEWALENSEIGIWEVLKHLICKLSLFGSSRKVWLWNRSFSFYI